VHEQDHFTDIHACLTAQDSLKARERLEDLKRVGKNSPRQRERISRSKIGKQQEGECAVM
jgi:hypothetical protein